MRRRYRQHCLLALGAVFQLYGCSRESGTPSTDAITQALQAEYGAVVRVADVQRTNGIDFPGGNGAPQQYAVEFQATLVPSEPVTFQIASGLEQSMLQGGAVVKAVTKGHEADPQGLNVLLDIGTQRWRTDSSKPAQVVGTVRFVKTENGWRQTALQTQLSKGLMAEIREARRLEAAKEEERSQVAARAQREAQRVYQLNERAWSYAISPESTEGNVVEAVNLAKEAIQTTDPPWNFFGTLGTAYARNGQFAEAVEMQTRGLAMLRETSNLTAEQKATAIVVSARRLELFRQRKPYIELPRAPLTDVQERELNEAAWRYAASPDPAQRDGVKAVDIAMQAVQKSFHPPWNFFGTLATAYARNGQFSEAVEMQTLALAMLRETRNLTPEQMAPRVAASEQRLELFRQRKPYAEPPPGQ